MNARIALCLTAFAFLSGFASTAMCQGRGQLNLPEFAGLAEKASESVTVTLDSKMLGFAARFLDGNDPEQAAAQQLVASLTGIYVRKFSFDKDFDVPTADIAGVRRQLSAPGWSPIVAARSNKENTQVDVYMLVEGDRAQGLAIIATEPREFVIVNIVGSIDLEKLHQLEGSFGVPKLGIETGKKPAAREPAAAPAAAPKK